MENPPPGFDPSFHEEMKRRARLEFRSYFAVASPADEQVMDAAYVGAKAYRQAVRTPRPKPDDPMRHPLEIVTNSAEQLLLFVRDALRKSEAFKGLTAVERARIETRLFQ